MFRSFTTLVASLLYYSTMEQLETELLVDACIQGNSYYNLMQIKK